MVNIIEKDPEKLKPISFMKYSMLWISISLVAIAIGVAFMVMNNNDPKIGTPVKLGIDYTGGNLISGTTGKDVTSHEVFEIVKKYSTVEPVVQVIQHEGTSRDIEIRTKIKFDPSAPEPEQNTQRNDNLAQLKEELKSTFGGFTLKAQEYVGPTVGHELIRNAVIALVIGSVLILIYIFARFGNFVFAISAVLALVHDVLITMGGIAIFKMEMNAAFIAVILTIIGYSINDTIIIFDRIRENMKKYPMLEFTKLADISITQTIVRSVATVLTVIIMLLALLFFGSDNIQDFIRALLIGMISGAYSSIYIATPLVQIFRKKEQARVALSISDAVKLEYEHKYGEESKKTKASAKSATAKPVQPRPAAPSVKASKDEELEVETEDETEPDKESREKRILKKKGKARRR